MSNLFLQFGLNEVSSGSKVILSAPKIEYPAIYSLWRKENDIHPTHNLLHDDILIEQINLYIEKSNRILDEIEKRIESIIISVPELIVWGTGQLVMKLLAETSLRSANIIAYVDGNPINHGKSIKGCRIISPTKQRI